LITWELKTEAETIAAGRNPNLLSQGELWPDTIIEVDPGGSHSVHPLRPRQCKLQHQRPH
jgi:hypothetical protein